MGKGGPAIVEGAVRQLVVFDEGPHRMITPLQDRIHAHEHWPPRRRWLKATLMR